MSKIIKSFDIKRHDTLPTLAVTIHGFQTNPDGRSVTFTMQKLNSLDPPAVLDGTCPPISGSILETEGDFEGTYKTVVSYPWQAGDTDVAGSYTGEFEITLGADKITAPDQKVCELRIEISPDLNDT